MIAAIIAAIPAFAGFPVGTAMIMPAVLHPSPRRDRTAWAGVVAVVVIYSAGLLVSVLLRQWPMAACYAAFLAAIGFIYWLHQRRRRRKAHAASLGYKSRVRIEDLVRAMRETLRRRHVLAPGGAS